MGGITSLTSPAPHMAVTAATGLSLHWLREHKTTTAVLATRDITWTTKHVLPTQANVRTGLLSLSRLAPKTTTAGPAIQVII